MMNMQNLTLLLAPIATLALSNAPAHAGLGDQLFKLLASDGAGGESLGDSVAISGGTTIVGAPYDDDNGGGSGSAYLFNSITGVQIAKLLPNDGAELDFFGDSVSIGGSPGKEIAIVGSRLDDDNGTASGSAYLFDATTGRQIVKLLPDDGAANHQFGWSVTISGNTCIVGAPQHNAAYLFDISDPTNPIQLFKLVPDDGAMPINFGNSVAISGNTCIVGAAQGYNDNGDQSGSAYLFDISSGLQLFKLLADDGAAGDLFGQSVAINGPIAIVGARWDDDNGAGSGSAYLFSTSTGLQLAKLLPSDGEANDNFGFSVAINSATALVGALVGGGNWDTSGSAYLFDITTGNQIIELLAEDGAFWDNFGCSVALSDDTAIVGVRQDDDNGPQSGSAFLFDAAPGKCPWDLNNSGSVGTSDLLALFAQWGSAGAADFDGSGAVGTADLLILFANWGVCV